MTIKVVHIREKLAELGMAVEDVVLGDYDRIGELTAKKARGVDSALYKSVGCYFRPNYERGLLAAAMINRYKPKSVLEIGFGRGYWLTCAAKAMHESGLLDYELVSIDAKFDTAHIENMSKYFPEEWLKHAKLIPGESSTVLKKLAADGRKFDIVYIDGDHTYDGVKADWELVKGMFTKYVIFDDYHIGDGDDPNIQVSRMVDEIPDEYERELVIMDRELFIDDRIGMKTEDKRYGQVIMKHPDFSHVDRYAYDW